MILMYVMVGILMMEIVIVVIAECINDIANFCDDSDGLMANMMKLMKILMMMMMIVVVMVVVIMIMMMMIMMMMWW